VALTWRTRFTAPRNLAELESLAVAPQRSRPIPQIGRTDTPTPNT